MGQYTDADYDPDDDLEPDGTAATWEYPSYAAGTSWTATVVDSSTGTAKQFTSSAEFPKLSTWWDGQCVNNESRYKIIKRYPREDIHSRMVGDESKLYCGMENRDGNESKFGLRHIKQKHKDEFGELASWQGSTWGNFMHWAIWHIIEDPDNVRNQSSIRFCYEKEFFFEGPDDDTYEQWIAVILGETGVRIMSAFPKHNDPGQPYCPRGTYIQ